MFGAIQGIANIFRQKKANKALDQILSQDVRYQKNPFANTQLSLAQQMFGDPSLGTRNQVEKGIQTNNANFMGNVNANATDSSQALALGAAGLGQSNQDIVNANTGFQKNKLALTDNLNQAYGGMINEGDKDYQDLIRRYSNLAEIKGQQQQNKTNALNGVFNGLNSDINQALQVAGLFVNPFGTAAGGFGGVKPTGTTGYQGAMPSGIGNRRTPNFGG